VQQIRNDLLLPIKRNNNNEQLFWRSTRTG